MKTNRLYQINDNSTKDCGDLVVNQKTLNKLYNGLDNEQLNYYNSILNYPMVCVDSPAGTGKTFIAVAAALQMFNERVVNKIYYIRIPDDRSLRLGFLPGTENDKQMIYTLPFYDACENLDISPSQIERAISQESIVLCTDIVMRGSNINKAAVIIDESQNGRLSDLKLILTRLSDDCKCMLIGHSSQYDNFKGVNEHAFEKYVDHLTTQPWAVRCNLVKNHRGKMSQWADKLEI